MSAKQVVKRDLRPPVYLVQQESPRGEGDSRTMTLNPLLAYPMGMIDPAASATRDEGELRLLPLRAALRQLQREHAGLCDEGGADTLVAALTPTVRLHGAVHAAIFRSEAPWKPRVCLVAPSTHLFSPEDADAMTEEHRVQCIPVADDPQGCVAFPNFPLVPPKRVFVHFDARRVGVGGAAAMKIERVGIDQLSVCVVSSSGERRSLRGAVVPAIADKLFAPSWASVLHVPKLLPGLPGELPQPLLDEVADFWQRHLRAHVVASVCAPDDATRPLAISAIRARLEGHQHKRAVVRCTLHRSSVPCACDLWKLRPMYERMPTERWVGSEVELTLSMCGHALGSSTRMCPLHGAATPNVSLLPTVCCHGTVASLTCSHQTQNRRSHHGLHQPDMRLSGIDVLHAQVLVASCMRCADIVAPLLGKAPTEQIDTACERVCEQALVKLDAVTRHRALGSKVLPEAELQARDMLAHDLLAEGGIYQYERPTTGELVLAKMGADGSATVLNADGGGELVETHLGLFPPPLVKRRKRRVFT
ncbi:MAG: hypothetical protein ACKVI4_15565 [Actinomycetales bacterium]